MGKFIDLTGQKINEWTVVELDKIKSKEKKKSYWICECSCGDKYSVSAGNLKNGLSKKCVKCYNKSKKSEDLTNQKFNKLTVIRRGEKNKYNQITWLCLCECGNETYATMSELKSSHKKSCGCLNYEYEDLTGKRFGKLVVIKRAEDLIGANGKKIIQWQCKCDCGNSKNIIGSNLTNKKFPVKSCGCLKEKMKLNLLNKQFGRWKVLKRAKNNKHGKIAN